MAGWGHFTGSVSLTASRKEIGFSWKKNREKEEKFMIPTVFYVFNLLSIQGWDSPNSTNFLYYPQKC